MVALRSDTPEGDSRTYRDSRPPEAALAQGRHREDEGQYQKDITDEFAACWGHGGPFVNWRLVGCCQAAVALLGFGQALLVRSGCLGNALSQRGDSGITGDVGGGAEGVLG